MLEDLREQIIGIIEEAHACKGQDKGATGSAKTLDEQDEQLTKSM